MSKFTWGTIIASVLILGGIIWFSYSSAGNGRVKPTSNGQTALAADHNTFDFGTISMKNGKVNHTFTFKNNGTDEIKLTKLYTSCMCTTANIEVNGQSYGPYGMVGMGIDTLNEVLPAGAEAKITATFDPAAHGPAGVGSITRDVTVENNAGAPLAFEFTANVTP